MKRILPVVALALCSAFVFAAEPDPAKPDVKTGVHENKADLETTTAIRKAIVADKTLSTAAHNVKIFTENGRVTLRGAVDSVVEAEHVKEKAIAVVGKEKVVSELEVKK